MACEPLELVKNATAPYCHAMAEHLIPHNYESYKLLNNSVSFPTCQKEWANVTLCADSKSRAFRLGPFSTRPGRWHHGVSLVPNLFAAGDRLKAVTGQVTNAHGQVIAFPPLYTHHIHIGGHFFVTHVDDESGGEHHVPAGYCVPVFQSWMNGVDVVYVVWHPEDSRPGPSEFYISVQFQLASPLDKCAPATPVELRQAVDTHQLAEQFSDRYFRYLAPDKPAVAWFAIRLPFSGQLLNN